jgi:plasmid stabilization system protein ParE
MIQAVFHPEADEEMQAAAYWYEQRTKGLGLSFLDEVQAGIERVATDPMAWEAVVGPIRRYLLKRFPYAILYQVEADRILILAVMHLHRQPGYWRRRT